MQFDFLRLRRLRHTEAIRALVQETPLSVNNLIAPLFVSELSEESEQIPSIPNCVRYPLSQIAGAVERLGALGIKGVMLFPVIDPQKKDPQGQESQKQNTLLCQAVDRVKARVGKHMCVFADVALDPYTSHGHDGIVDGATGDINNDATVEALSVLSVHLAQAGVDFVAPSDMMDGRVGIIRKFLDRAGYPNVGILAYSAKFASAFYGPFRHAVGAASQGLDKSTYQLSYKNSREALLEVLTDVDEGADMVMVKPALCYLDVIHRVRQATHRPVVAYHVSGECAMLRLGAAQGLFSEKDAVLETLTSIRRAGADVVITYYAQDVVQWLK